MPPRDEEDFQRKRQQIIDGAMHVFSTKGFEAATNKDIAQAARIGSPGLIYHYFKDKADLFKQVVEERADVLQLIEHSDEIMDQPPREVLTLFGRQLLQLFGNRGAVAMFRIMLGESMRRPAVAEMLNRIGPNRGFTFLTRYLGHQMDLGNLRRIDPGAAARCFFGPFIAYVITTEVFVQPDARTLSKETMLATTVDIFLSGMQPDEQK